MIIGAAKDRDESEEAREFFASLPEGERNRLMDLFVMLMDPIREIQHKDWRDRTPNGPRHAPAPTAMAARNGRR